MSAARVLLSPQMILLHVLGVVAVGVAGAMGWWQLGAWQEQREDRALAIADEEPRPLADVLGPDDPYPAADVGRPVRVEGEWLRGSTTYVEDRRRTSQAPDDGVWQVALLAACPDGACADASAMPVVLGWAPSPAAATAEPVGPGEVVGWLQPAEQSGADPDPEDDLLPTLRTADLLTRTDRDVFSGYVILDEPASLRGDLVAVTPESLPDPPASTALRNLLYGIEWWVFAAFAVYLWWRWSRDAVTDAREREPDQPVPSNV